MRRIHEIHVYIYDPLWLYNVFVSLARSFQAELVEICEPKAVECFMDQKELKKENGVEPLTMLPTTEGF